MTLRLFGSGEPPPLCLNFPKLRFYTRQLFINPNYAFKNVLHNVFPKYFRHPKEIYAENKKKRLEYGKKLFAEAKLKKSAEMTHEMEILDEFSEFPEMCVHSDPEEFFKLPEKVEGVAKSRKRIKIEKKRPFFLRLLPKKKKKKELSPLQKQLRDAKISSEYKSVKIQKKTKLGEGGFGQIYAAHCILGKKSGEYVRDKYAVKRIYLIQENKSVSNCLNLRKGRILVDFEIALREFSILQEAQGNQFTLKFIHSCVQYGRLTIITELCSYGDFFSILEKAKAIPTHFFYEGGRRVVGRVSCRMILFIFAPIFDALAHLHSLGYIHRDIKPENLFIDKKGIPKLADFGLAIAQRKKKGIESSFDSLENGNQAERCGTKYFMAPETAHRQEYNLTLDTWLTGFSMLFLAYGDIPYHFMKKPYSWNRYIKDKLVVDSQFKVRKADAKIYNLLNISSKSRLDAEEREVWSEFKKFLRTLMRIRPQDRPSCASIAESDMIAPRLAEWKLGKFEEFKEDWKLWHVVLQSM